MRLLLLLLLVAGVAAQSQLLDNAPDCAVKCVRNTSATGCAATDNACLCASTAQGVLLQCALGACDDEDDRNDITPPAQSSGGSKGHNGNGSSDDSGTHDTNTTQPSSSRSNVGAAVGGTLGGIALVALLAFLFLRWRRNKRRSHRSAYDAESEDGRDNNTYEQQQFHRTTDTPVEDPFASPRLGAAFVTSGPSIYTPMTNAEKTALADLTPGQKDMVALMLERGAAPSAVEDVMHRMRAENRGETVDGEGPPPQYDFEDAKGRHVMAAAPP
ncbi:hypothetical protein EXIGLDRAFT_719107 [Exidia glandulosa HHB12029]|uniref:CFEM domain-containing protein n=1 Tax=Exidia glandulosa HHB12029 TaxID=1314781 RepID=A0A165HBD6_EXIGL|nr:hypothetical protein EXIGLDRAFT_719107 [Exidia glandulosa HHB12029]